VDSLERGRDAHAQLPGDTSNLDAHEIERVAAALEQATTEEMTAKLSKLPADWPVTDHELDSVVAFADHRRGAVAKRVRSLGPKEDQ
jgi:hypothetical protein